MHFGWLKKNAPGAIPARLSVLAGGWWAMAFVPRYVGRDGLQVVQVVVNVFVVPKPELFRQDLIALFDLLQQKKIKLNAGYTARLPSANPRAAASALSSGRVLKAIAVPGATVRIALMTTSNSARLRGGRRTPAPMTTQS